MTNLKLVKMFELIKLFKIVILLGLLIVEEFIF